MDSDQGKLFIGGISWETSEETLKNHFEKYGDVVDSVIMRDRNTGSARGFGFVLFSDPAAADKALQDKHVISGRTVEVKKAVPRGEHQQGGLSKTSSTSQFRTKKIFVGGLSPNLTEEDFRNYFEKFGRITDVVVMYDSATHRPRGFGFITFESEDSVESVIQKTFHELNDKLVEVKRAVPKDGIAGNVNTRATIRGSVFNSHQGGVYPTFSPRYGIYHGYAPSPVSGYGNARGYTPMPIGGGFGAAGYGGGYPIGGYSGVPQAAGYGANFANGPPISAPRSPWNGPTIVGPRQSPVSMAAPYGNAVFPYNASASPGYVNGGVGGGGFLRMARGVMGAVNPKWSQGGGDAQATGGGYVGGPGPTQRIDGRKSNDDSASYGGTYGVAGRQNQRGPDARLRPYPEHVG